VLPELRLDAQKKEEIIKLPVIRVLDYQVRNASTAPEDDGDGDVT
jgi:hypothetical protein